MNLCDQHGRNEIAYESRDCPACEEVNDLKGTIQDLMIEIQRHETTIEKLEEKA